jgi:hypothetical protein
VDYWDGWHGARGAAGLAGASGTSAEPQPATLIAAGVDPFTTCQLVGGEGPAMLKRYKIVDPKTLKRSVAKPRNYLDRGVGAITAAPPLKGPLRRAPYLRNWRIAFSAGVSGGWIERGRPDGSTAGAGFGTS